MNLLTDPTRARTIFLLAIATLTAGCVGTQAASIPTSALANGLPDAVGGEGDTFEAGATLALALDEPTFWSLPHVDSMNDQACRIRGPPVGASLFYTIEVPDGTEHLRVAAERTLIAPCVRPFLVDPSGEVVITPPGFLPQTEASLMLTQEIFVGSPQAGSWSLGLLVQGANVDVRLRALASTSAPEVGGADGATLLPDLRPAPPFELKFQFPTSVDPGPTPVPAQGPLSCSPEEVLQNGAPVPCLRFSFGAGNLGPGALQLHYDAAGVPGLPRPATQWIELPDGTHLKQPAGQVVLHAMHGHYHWDDAYVATLYAVRPDGTQASLANGWKITGCLGDIMFTAWERFDQGAVMSDGTSNMCLGSPVAPNGAPASLLRQDETIGLTPGWMDVYPSTLPDNYVPFADGDGEYVLVFTVDPEDLVMEADETNNDAYAWFRVTGQTIEVIERGYGAGPHDPTRVVVPAPWVT